MRSRVRSFRPLAVLLGALLCVAVTVGLFARAYPMVDAGLTLDRLGAIARARSLAAAAGFAPTPRGGPTGAALPDAAARFDDDGALTTYVDFAAGGPDSVRALVRGRDVPLYRWAVRLYRPGDVHETRIGFAPDGRTVALARKIPEGEARPLVSDTAGRLAADAALARWGSQNPAQWRITGRSVVTQPRSGRVDRTYRYERVGRRIGDAPLRADVTVTGPAPSPLAGGAQGIAGAVGAGQGIAGQYAAEPLEVRVYADLPEAWTRRYGEMRSANNTLALFAYPGLTAFTLAAMGALIAFGRLGRVRWRPAAMVGGTVGLLMAAAGFNELPQAWFGYPTETAPGTFIGGLALQALAGGALAGLWVTLAVAAAEACARRAFPDHYDWFAYPRFAGAAPIARRVLGGYALAAFGFAYVTVFYLTVRGAFGWWVPTGTLDDPNQIATPAPWVSAVGTALFAGTWEEAIFRGVPLALLAFWARDRKRRGLWLGLGVVFTALTFGFGHANYPSWPAYSRGVELFLEAVLWAVLAVRVGLPTTIVAHALYDLTWFGLFALHGRGAAYRATAGAVLVAFALPALVVLGNWWQRRRALAAGLTVREPPRFRDVTRALDALDVAPAEAGVHPSFAPASGIGSGEGWAPASAGATVQVPRAATPALTWPTAARVGPRTRLAAAVVIVLAAAVALLAPHPTPLGPAFTAPRARIALAADSALRARGVDPAGWDRTLVVAASPNEQAFRFLRESLDRTRAAALVRRLGANYLAPTLWQARYVRRHAPLALRREEWGVVVAPDGQVRTVVHEVADDAPGASPTADSARALAAAAVRGRGYDPVALHEVELEQTARPHRLDTRVEYVDPAAALPAGATARVGVTLAGAEAVSVAREVRLPEAWLLKDRNRETTQGLLAAVAAFGVLGLLFAFGVRAIRRAEPQLPAAVTRRGVVAVGFAVALLTLARTAQTLPARLADWDTTNPWSFFLTTLAIGAALGAVLAGAASGGAWALVDALRRRAGVPLLPATDAGPSASGPSGQATRRVRDGVLLGAALGTALPALTGLGDFARTAVGTPPVPSTALDALLPWAAPALGAATSAVNAPLAALPVLAIGAGTHTARGRLLALAGLAALVALSAQVAADETIGPWALAGGAVAGVALVALVVWAFGRAAALPWFVAGPAAGVLASLRAARDAANSTDRAAALLGALVAAVLIAAVYRAALRYARREAPVAPAEAGVHPSPPRVAGSGVVEGWTPASAGVTVQGSTTSATTAAPPDAAA